MYRDRPGATPAVLVQGRKAASAFSKKRVRCNAAEGFIPQSKHVHRARIRKTNEQQRPFHMAEASHNRLGLLSHASQAKTNDSETSSLAELLTDRFFAR